MLSPKKELGLNPEQICSCFFPETLLFFTFSGSFNLQELWRILLFLWVLQNDQFQSQVSNEAAYRALQVY